MSHISSQLKTNEIGGIGKHIRPNDLPAKLFNLHTSQKPSDARNQASYFDETAYFDNTVDFDELDYFAYHKSFDDAELGGKNN